MDLFCGGGGAGFGYAQAGFEVHGCDITWQKRYPFPMLVMDWRECLETYGHLFDAFHCSPECQGYCALSHMVTKRYNMEIPQVREALQATGKPWVIENVARARQHMRNPLMLCGSMFGLQTDCGAQLRRHRLFEAGIGAEPLLLMSPGPCRHGEVTIAVQGHQATNETERRKTRRTIGVTGPGNALSGGRTIMVVGATPKDPAAERRKYRTVTVTGSTPQQNVERNQIRETFSIEEARTAMGIDWLTMKELSQAIPPAYSEFVGRQLLEVCR